MWIDLHGRIVGDGEAYVDVDGTTYLGAFPKDRITGLSWVTPSPRPDTTPSGWTVDGQPRGGVVIDIIDGHEWRVENVDGIPTQMWNTVVRSDFNTTEARAVKKAEIERRRDQALAGGINWAALDGTVHRIQSDATSRDNLTGIAAGLAAGLSLPTGFSWRTAANVDVVLDEAGLLSLAGAMLAHVNTCWQVSWAKKAEVDALTDPEAIAGYDVTTGW